MNRRQLLYIAALLPGPAQAGSCSGDGLYEALRADLRQESACSRSAAARADKFERELQLPSEAGPRRFGSACRASAEGLARLVAHLARQAERTCAAIERAGALCAAEIEATGHSECAKTWRNKGAAALRELAAQTKFSSEAAASIAKKTERNQADLRLTRSLLAANPKHWRASLQAATGFSSPSDLTGALGAQLLAEQESAAKRAARVAKELVPIHHLQISEASNLEIKTPGRAGSAAGEGGRPQQSARVGSAPAVPSGGGAGGGGAARDAKKSLGASRAGTLADGYGQPDRKSVGPKTREGAAEGMREKTVSAASLPLKHVIAAGEANAAVKEPGLAISPEPSGQSGVNAGPEYQAADFSPRLSPESAPPSARAKPGAGVSSAGGFGSGPTEGSGGAVELALETASPGGTQSEPSGRGVPPPRAPSNDARKGPVPITKGVDVASLQSLFEFESSLGQQDTGQIGKKIFQAMTAGFEGAGVVPGAMAAETAPLRAPGANSPLAGESSAIPAATIEAGNSASPAPSPPATAEPSLFARVREAFVRAQLVGKLVRPPTLGKAHAP